MGQPEAPDRFVDGARLGERRPERVPEDDLNAVESHCIFTTHTPVPAGHDKFKTDLVEKVLGPERLALLEAARCCPEGVLNMTFLALTFSRYTNGVAMLHGEVSGQMFPNFPVHAITNGVHAATWICPCMAELFDRRIGGWRSRNCFFYRSRWQPANGPSRWKQRISGSIQGHLCLKHSDGRCRSS